MTEPHIKTREGENGLLICEMDQAGHELFQRLLNRAEPRRNDNPKTFQDTKDRINGAFLAGAVVMGWKSKGS
ncbi:hypothetical protein [Celeribacter sp. SCSIO 80788]|uniref:hypothetical protein n=1 Tax=Celeribacter sp. SCSIO 80788 TaxID=3117013 RepID=UPI003DA27378